MRHLYSPGAVKRIGVKVRKARGQNCSRFTVNISSTKGCIEIMRKRQKEKGEKEKETNLLLING